MESRDELTGRSLQIQASWMLRLIEANLGSTGQQHLSNRTPSGLLNFRTLNILLCEGSYFSFQVVTHEEKFMNCIVVRRVESSFRRRQGEDQPAMTCIYRFESQHVTEKCSVRFGVLAVDNYVSTRNHFFLPKNCPHSLPSF